MSNSTVFKMISSISFIFSFIFMISFIPTQINAQKKLTVINFSFEKPDSGKIKGFDGKCSDASWKAGGGKLFDIPGWSVDSKDSLQRDSGIEIKATSDGKYDGYMMGGDPGIYQNLSRRVLVGDQIKLTVDARNSWKGTNFLMELYYLDGDTAKAPRVSIVSDTKTLTNTMVGYSVSFKASDFPAAVGKKMGILLDNVSPDSASWTEFDNVRLTNEDPRIIEITNFSFEQPDTGKIKGWDGICADPAYTGIVYDVLGWQSDEFAFDSGIEATSTTEGQWVAFLMAQDSTVYQVTDYAVQAGDQIELKIDASYVWSDGTNSLMQMGLFYLDGSNRVPIVSNTIDIFNVKDWTEHSISFSANDHLAAVGKKLGIALKDRAAVARTWFRIDNVRLFKAGVTDVNDNSIVPTNFSLAQNYPNPFNPSTKISYSIAKQGKVRLSVYDILGREVAVLVNSEQNVGTYNVQFNAEKLSSGIYFYRLQSNNNTMAKKMILMK